MLEEDFFFGSELQVNSRRPSPLPVDGLLLSGTASGGPPVL
jgi:hypothetical protein